MANNFFVYKNLRVGKSLIEKNVEEIIENIYKKAQANNCEILIPQDCIVGKNFGGEGTNKNLDEIRDDEIILDIGINTIKNINKKIDKSNTVLWNGPAGYFENDNFSKGTLSIAENISKKYCRKIINFYPWRWRYFSGN